MVDSRALPTPHHPIGSSTHPSRSLHLPAHPLAGTNGGSLYLSIFGTWVRSQQEGTWSSGDLEAEGSTGKETRKPYCSGAWFHQDYPPTPLFFFTTGVALDYGGCVWMYNVEVRGDVTCCSATWGRYKRNECTTHACS